MTYWALLMINERLVRLFVVFCLFVCFSPTDSQFAESPTAKCLFQGVCPERLQLRNNMQVSDKVPPRT